MVLKMPHWTCHESALSLDQVTRSVQTFIRSTILERGTAMVKVCDAPVLVQSPMSKFTPE
jgi:hypothetical protein